MRKVITTIKDYLAFCFDDFNRPRTLKAVENYTRKYGLQLNLSTAFNFAELSEETFLKHTLAHYEAQNHFRTNLRIFLTEALSVMYLSFMLPVTLIKSHFDKSSYTQKRLTNIPLDLQDVKSLKDVKITGAFKRSWRLRKSDIELLIKLTKLAFKYKTSYPLQIIAKAAKDMACVRASIEREQPQIIIVSWEYSASLSILALQMRGAGVRLFNVMHGDKSSSTLDSFFIVERCYCWHNFYIDLFKEQGARSNFLIYEPDWLKNEFPTAQVNNSHALGIVLPNLDMYGDITAELKELHTQLKAISAARIFKNIYIRPHPLQHDTDMLAAFQNIDICSGAYPKDETEDKFFEKCDIVAGFYSTLLLQATYRGKPTIYFNCFRVKNLKDYHFVFARKEVYIREVNTLLPTLQNLTHKDAS